MSEKPETTSQPPPQSQPRPQPTGVPSGGTPLKKGEPTAPRPLHTGVPRGGAKRFDGADDLNRRKK